MEPPGSAHWAAVCRQHAERAGLRASVVEALAAFGGGEGRTAADFSTLLAASQAAEAGLARRITQTLTGEVDEAQAAMFSRRFSSVCALLSGLVAPEAALLQVGLVQRMSEVLDGPGPLALRVRALVDFYYSQAGLLHHDAPGLPDIGALVGGAVWRPVAAGIAHAQLSGLTRQGPVHVNVLRVRGGRVAALDCRGRGSLAEIIAQTGAAAAVSGGFFLYSEPDIAPPSRRTDPVGLLVSAGRVISPPTFRRSALLFDGARLAVQEIGLHGCTLRQDHAGVWIAAVNAPEQVGRAVVAFSRAWGRESPPAAMSVAVVGQQITAVASGALPIPLAGAVLALPRPLPLTVGPVRWRLPVQASEAMAGGPRLLRDGVPEISLVEQDFSGSAPPVTFSQDETFDQNLLPRMAAGLTGAGELMLVAIDGRNFSRALGMTLRQTARLCRLLGCTEAMNLDGGSSKRMVIGQTGVDLSSTEVVAGARSSRVRPVHSGLLLFPAQ